MFWNLIGIPIKNCSPNTMINYNCHAFGHFSRHDPDRHLIKDRQSRSRSVYLLLIRCCSLFKSQCLWCYETYFWVHANQFIRGLLNSFWFNILAYIPKFDKFHKLIAEKKARNIAITKTRSFDQMAIADLDLNREKKIAITIDDQKIADHSCLAPCHFSYMIQNENLNVFTYFA